MKKRTYKRILSSVIAFLVLVSMVHALNISAAKAEMAETGTTPEGIEYVIGDGEVEITGYSGKTTDLTIPSTIQDYPVTSLADSVFEGCESLESVLIPEGVTRIGWAAFKDCESLKSITIPEGVTSIGGWAFMHCSSLGSITIPSSVTSIGDSAFSGCNSLANIAVDEDNLVYDSRDNCNAIIDTATNTLLRGCKNTVIPSDVTNIGDSAFSGCTFLESITIPQGVTSIGDSAFSDCLSLESITILEGVTSIGDYAFSHCESLKSITIPQGVTSIGYAAFCYCYALESITISQGVTSIGEYAFDSCTSLASIAIPSGVTSIGNNTFFCCTSLESVTIPSSVANIGTRAFSHCESLENITISQGVTSIGDYAFSDCYSLESIMIPQGVTSIGNDMFGKCESLESIIVDENNSVYDSRDNCNAIIETSTNTLISGCKNTVIPSSITSIGKEAFFGRESLYSITIPSSVTSIGWAAFANCCNLADVYYSGSQEQWNEIEIDGYGNSYLLDATIHYENDATEPITTVPAETDPAITIPEDFITDEKTNISVVGETDAELVVSEITSDKQIEDIDLILIGEKVSNVFDITLQKDGAEVQPNGNVSVYIPSESSDSKVYRMETDGTLTDMNAVYKDGYLIFITEHFSIYVVTEKSGESTPPEGTYLLGDANGDGKVNVKDATQIQKAAASLVNLDEEQAQAADVNGDGKVNVKDATAIQKFVAGIPVDFPIGE